MVPRQSRCARCGMRDGPGHGCERRWTTPRWLRLGPLKVWGIKHSGFKTSAGGLDHTYWVIFWTWRGDVHHFVPRPSLGTHTNVSERNRLERLGSLPDVDSLWEDEAA